MMPSLPKKAIKSFFIVNTSLSLLSLLFWGTKLPDGCVTKNPCKTSFIKNFPSMMLTSPIKSIWFFIFFRTSKPKQIYDFIDFPHVGLGIFMQTTNLICYTREYFHFCDGYLLYTAKQERYIINSINYEASNHNNQYFWGRLPICQTHKMRVAKFYTLLVETFLWSFGSLPIK